MIIDDEEIVRMGIRDLIDWEKRGLLYLRGRAGTGATVWRSCCSMSRTLRWSISKCRGFPASI